MSMKGIVIDIRLIPYPGIPPAGAILILFSSALESLSVLSPNQAKKTERRKSITIACKTRIGT